MCHIYLSATEWNFLFEFFHTKHLKAVPLVWNGAFQKSLQRTVSVCVGLILTLGSQKLTIFGTQWDAEQTECPLKLLAEDMQITGVHLNLGVFTNNTGYLIPAQDLIVISYANIADFNTLIHAYIFMCTQSCFEKETCIHLYINICLYYIFKIYLCKYGRILSCLMSGEVSLCGWWQLYWSVNQICHSQFCDRSSSSY